MTGHDLDLDELESRLGEYPNAIAHALLKEVRDLRAKLAAAEQERDAIRRDRDRLIVQIHFNHRVLAAVRETVETFGQRFEEARNYRNPATKGRALYTKLEAELDRILTTAEQEQS